MRKALQNLPRRGLTPWTLLGTPLGTPAVASTAHLPTYGCRIPQNIFPTWHQQTGDSHKLEKRRGEGRLVKLILVYHLCVSILQSFTCVNVSNWTGFYKTWAYSSGMMQTRLTLSRAFLFVPVSSPGVSSSLPQTSLFAFFVVFSFRRLLDSSAMT